MRSRVRRESCVAVSTRQMNPRRGSAAPKSMRRLQTMLDHMYTRRRLSAYLDGELDGDARGRVERHTHECEDCGKTLGALGHIGAALRHLGHLQRSPSPTGRVAQARERSQGTR